MQTDGEPSGGVRVSGGLGVRPLPLLSDAAYASFQSGRHGAEAILEVAQRVFGDAYSAFYEVSVWERSRQRSIGGEGVNDLGVARDIVQHALSSNSPSEGDVLTLSAYLLLEAEDRSIDSTTPLYVAGAAEVLGMALAEGAAGRYGTCDSMLAFAHARSLAWVSTPDAVDSLFDAATAVCGEDVTAAVAKGYYDLGYASVGAGAGDDPCRVDAATISLDSWKPILREFRAIQKSAPGNPAGYVGEGDTYRIAAELLSQWNVEPFTIRSFRAAAIRAYQKARSFSSDEDIAKSMAKVYVAQGDSDEAERMLSGTATDEHSASALALRSDIAAAERDYEEAGQLAQQSWDADLNDSSDRYLRIRQLQGSNAAFGATDVTGGEDSAGANVLGQRACGGVSLTHDRSLAPAYRRSEDGFPEQPQLGYWVLAKEWNRADGEACTYAAAQADVLACEVLASQGQVEGLSNAANDYYQNLLRSVGDLEGAARVAHSWAASAPLSPTAHERLGEIAFLQHDWLKAKSESSTAADLYVEDPDPIGAYSVSTGAQWARLRQGSADRESGDSRASLAVLEPLAEELDGQSLTAHEYEAVLHMDVEQELGLAEYDRNEFDTAIDHFERSIEIGRYAEASLSAKVLRGVQAQAASTAALKLGRLDGAAAFAQQAVDIDPYNPLFRETLAEAERGRDRGAAIASYRAALEEDASMFSTWNNLGVLLGRVSIG